MQHYFYKSIIHKPYMIVCSSMYCGFPCNTTCNKILQYIFFNLRCYVTDKNNCIRFMQSTYFIRIMCLLQHKTINARRTPERKVYSLLRITLRKYIVLYAYYVIHVYTVNFNVHEITCVVIRLLHA